MFNIADYYQVAMISQGQPLGEDYHVYSMDGHPGPRGNEHDMAKHVGLPSCHCCDCFIFEKESIALIEITDMSRSKKRMEKEPSDIYLENKEDYFYANFARENMLKMYGSMAVLCWFSHECKTMANNLKKKYKFWLVASCSIRNIRALGIIESNLKCKLKGVASGFLIEVAILSPETLKEKIRKNAVKPVSV